MLGLCFMELLLNAIVICKESLWFVSDRMLTFKLCCWHFWYADQHVTNILNLSPTYYGLNILASCINCMEDDYYGKTQCQYHKTPYFTHHILYVPLKASWQFGLSFTAVIFTLILWNNSRFETILFQWRSRRRYWRLGAPRTTCFKARSVRTCSEIFFSISPGRSQSYFSFWSLKPWWRWVCYNWIRNSWKWFKLHWPYHMFWLSPNYWSIFRTGLIKYHKNF